MPDRAILETLLYLACNGSPCRALPAELGRWDAVYNRFRRWVTSGSLRAPFELLMADRQFGEVRRALIDSTIVRAHLHTAGARSKQESRGGAVGGANPRL